MTMKDLAYRLWLSIIGVSHTNLSMNIYHIKSILNQRSNSLQNSYSPLPMQNLLSQNEESQLDKVRKKNTIRVAFTDDKAYWVYDNTFYETDVVDGHDDNDNARPVDAHKLSSKELAENLRNNHDYRC